MGQEVKEVFFSTISMCTFLITYQIHNNNKIKRNNTEGTTKPCPCFSFPEKKGILNIS